MRMAFDLKEEFGRSETSSLSGIIDIDRAISGIHRRKGSYRHSGKTTVNITNRKRRPKRAVSPPRDSWYRFVRAQRK
jgi:hypothetical protein